MEKQILNKILENQEEMKKDQHEMKDTIVKMQGDIVEIKDNYNRLESKVNDIDKVVMRIEYEHGDKIRALLDAVTCNNEKYDTMKRKNKNKFGEIDFITMSHEVRIEKLEKGKTKIKSK